MATVKDNLQTPPDNLIKWAKMTAFTFYPEISNSITFSKRRQEIKD